MKITTILIAVASCLIAAICPTATAQNRFRVIEYRTGNPDKVVTQYNTSGDVTHPVAQTTYQVSLLGGANDTDEELYNNDIARVTFTGGPSGLLTIVVGYSFGETDDSQTAAARHWNGLVVSPSSANRRLSGGILGNLTGEITGVRSISRLDVYGEIRKSVKAAEPHNGSLFVVEAGTVTSSGGVALSSGNITRVQTVGAMAGTITGGVAPKSRMG